MASKIKFLTLAVLTCCMISLNSVSVFAFFPEPSASQLNQRGFILLNEGKAHEALEAWKQATERYNAEGNSEGTIGTQLNQAVAFQALGLITQACLKVSEAIDFPSQFCSQEINRDSPDLLSSLGAIESNAVMKIGLRILGEIFRASGNPAQAELVLSFIQRESWPKNPNEDAQVALALANSYHSSALAAVQTLIMIGPYDVQGQENIASELNEKIAKSIEQYQLAEVNPQLLNLSVVNQFDLFVDIHTSIDAAVLPEWTSQRISLQSLDSAAAAAYRSFPTLDWETLPVIESIYARLNLGENLLTARQLEARRMLGQPPSITDIQQLAAEAKESAQSIGNDRALSFALGLEAQIAHAGAAPTSEVESLYTQALTLAQSIHAYDIAYDWAYHLAQLTQKEKRTQEAEEYYQSAIANLTQVREDLITVNSELRFSFRRKVEPVYRDYIKYLVTSSNAEASLSKAVEIYESLQLAELENFLRCGRLIPSGPEEADETTTIYVINLSDELLEVIASTKSGLFGYQLPADNILQSARNLAANIQSPSFVEVPEAEFLPYAQTLYAALLKPALDAGYLSSSQSLKFVLDAPFQAIPMGILHDGEQYLAQQYVISNSLALSRPDRRSVKSTRALFAGLIEPSTGVRDPLISETMGALPETELEAVALRESVQQSKALIDEEFTVNEFEDEIATGTYHVVHVSSHGQFSSIPERTFLLAWDDLISMNDIAQIFDAQEEINLLVLSACQTAAGDDRSILGLAGIAVESGAENAIASLWIVDTIGSAVLIDFFYQGLASGLQNAEALQQAQATLIENTEFRHPYFWAPFILVEG